jgi:hypothetical protein
MQGVLVFANATARDAAITSPQEGQFAFTKDNDSLWYYSGSAWVSSGATGDIEGVTAGTGISGGGTSGTVTVTNSMATAIDAKGDLIVGTGADTFARLGVGTNGHTIVADSAEATGLKWAAPASGLTFVGASVYNVAVQSIANGTFTALNFDSENYDTDGFHSTSSNTSRFTIPTGKGGKYLINATFEVDDNATGQRTLAFYKNGSVEIYCGNVASNTRQPKSIGNVVLDLAANDYVEAFYYQDSGTSRNITLGQLYARFTINYLGA